MSLYEISQRYKGALSLIENGDLSLEDMKDTLEGVEGEFKEKAVAVAMYGQNQLVLANAKKELAKKLTDEAKALEKKNQDMLDYLDEQMTATGITEISCDYFKLRYRNLPDIAEVIDLEKLPKKFKKSKTVVTPDKVLLKKALLDGSISGAELIQNRKKLELK